MFIKMNDIKLLDYLQERLKEKNNEIKEIMINIANLTLTNEKYKNIIEILISLLALSVVGNVLMILIFTH